MCNLKRLLLNFLNVTNAFGSLTAAVSLPRPLRSNKYLANLRIVIVLDCLINSNTKFIKRLHSSSNENLHA